MKIEILIEFFLYIIIFIKIFFILATVGHLIVGHLSNKSTNVNKVDLKFLYWKERTEFIFIFLMALLLIFIFNPRYDNKKFITKEMSLLFFLFGIILIITADWNLFFTEAKWYKAISDAAK
jgi:hypothetical protein